MYTETFNPVLAEPSYELETSSQWSAVLLYLFLFSILVMGILSILMLLNRKKIKRHYRAHLHQLYQQHRQEMAQELVMAQEYERKKIAEKLHDEMAAGLSIAKLNLDQLELELEVADVYCGANSKLQTTQKILGDISDTVRNINHTLMPVTLEQLGLKHAILDFLISIDVAHLKIEEVILGLTDTENWDEDYCLKFFRIVQEILHNIIKHSGATHVLVQIIELEQSVTLYFEDNGSEPKNNPIQGGTGLKLLKSNVEFLKGTLEITAGQNGGTVVLIELPVPGNP